MTRRVTSTVGLALLLSGILALVFRPGIYPPYAEGRTYVQIANLDFSNVPTYYGGRVLHPLAVRFVATLAHAPIDARAFLWVSAAALIAFFLCLGAYYGLQFLSAPWLWLLLIATPTILDPYRNYYWHDMFYAALCGLFFLALRAYWWLGLPIVLMLYVTRESTIVLIFALVVVASYRRQWALLISALVVGLVGMKIQSTLVAHALPNRHGIPMFLLDALKIPYNFLLNICGLEFWINTNADTTEAPKWIASLPVWQHLGNIHQIGFSGFFWDRPARTLLLMSTAFGILPIVILRAAKRCWSQFQLGRLDLALALIYGSLMLVLAPLQGTLPARYIIYAWPVFWLFGVAVLDTAFPKLQRRIEIILLSFCAAWTPAVVGLFAGPSAQGAESLSDVSQTGLLISLALVAAIYIYAWRLFKPTPLP